MSEDTKPTEPSKMVNMKLSAETLRRLEPFRELYGWTPGEVLVRLLDYHDRIKNAVEQLGHGVLNDGTPVVFLRHSVDGKVDFLNNSQETRFLAWLIEELGEPVPLAFQDISSYPEEWENFNS